MPPKAKVYLITVEIEQTTLDILRADPHNVLVLVRDIGLGSNLVQGNIAFATYDSKDLSKTQTFIWEESHNVAEATHEFKHGVEVQSGTDTAGILRGQEATVNANSTITVTGRSDPTGDITVNNVWKNSARVVLGCKCLGDDPDGDVMNPYYISPPSVLGDIRVLTPVQSFSMVSTSNMKTFTMIDVKRGKTGHFEITEGKNDCVIKYDTTVPSVEDQWMAVKNATKL